jgi:hypothetical protein
MAWHKHNIPHPDDAALHVIEELLIGGRSSRFNKILIEEKQLLSSVDIDREMPGSRWDNLFYLEAEPRAPHTAAEAEAAIWEELERLKREPVSERELAKAKNRIRASWVRDLENNLRLAINLAYAQASHRDWRILLESADAVEALTAEDVQAVARKTFRPNRTIVATLVEPVVEMDPEKEKAARAAVAKMVTALGGEEALSGLRSLQATADVTLHTPGGEMTASAKNTYGVPDRMRGEFTFFGQTMMSSVGPDAAWRTQQGRVIDVEGEDATEMRQDLGRDMFLLAYPLVASDYVLQALDPEDGAERFMARGLGGDEFTVALSAETGLPLTVTYQGSNPMTGEDATIVESFADYRDVGGIHRPHAVTTTIDGETFAVSAVSEILINAELPADVFVRPAE